MNNYDEIAKEAFKIITGRDTYTSEVKRLYDSEIMYQCAYQAARLQAERFNKDLDNSYIESLNKEDAC